MKIIFFILLTSLLFYSCDENKRADETDAPPKSKDSARTLKESLDHDFSVRNLYVSEAPADSIQTTVVSGVSAVFTQPDTSAIKNLIEDKGEEEFYTLSDDNLFYQNQASEFLSKKGLEIVMANTRYISFVGKSKTFHIDTQAADNKGWLSILFDPEKEPKLFNPIKPEEDYNKYFNKK